MTLPLIDFFGSPDAGGAIDEAFSSLGFLQLRNIGIDPVLIDQVFRASAAFFNAPEDLKRRCAYTSAAENFGYQGLLEENLDPDAPADLKQSFSMRNILDQPPPDERWPSAAFRELMQQLFGEALAATYAIQRQMAVRLGLDPDYFVRVHSGENITLRLLHYPASGTPEPVPDQFGAGAHTDYGFITLLFQTVAGLQVVDHTGAWIDVPPQPDAIVVNSGDLLERWTNGRYKSTMHRVIAKTGDRDRLSVVFFVDPDSDTIVEALPSCVSEHQPARYPPISTAAHLLSKLEATHKGRFDTLASAG